MKSTIISIAIAVLFIGGAIMLGGRGSGSAVAPGVNNVSIVGGKQIIEITAKGGYQPRASIAKAGIPTAIKVITRGTFDCSAAVSIPSIGYRQNLPSNGEALIDIPVQPAGTKLTGLCAMGMYNFTIQFD